jgi:hypothetical protein
VVTGKPLFEAVVAAHGATVLRVARAILGPPTPTTSAPEEFHVKSTDLAAAYPVADTDLDRLRVRLAFASEGLDAKQALLNLEGAA